jgi:hypothetical protein
LTPENLLVKVSEPKIFLTLATLLLYLLMTGARGLKDLPLVELAD